MDDCSTCHGRRHVRVQTGWMRCPDCLARTVSASYIHPALRGPDPLELPPTLDGAAPLPLDRFWAVSGDYVSFRRRAWASLLHYEPTVRLNYDVIDAYRVTEINFQRDDPEHGYGSISEVAALQLLILPITGGPGNPYTGPVLHKLLEWRMMAGRPTWTFVGLANHQLRLFLGDVPALYDVLATSERLDAITHLTARLDAARPAPTRSRIARPRPAS